ncbi:MAG TPA: glycosyltransferase family 2 protein [Patescibacteria group bacterium]|nr:glycosyltransferase family 2 protein [Patescibacteria group bacterium]
MINYLYYKTRFLDYIPGTISWLVLIAPIIIAATYPTWIAIFVIIFDFYWLVRAIIFGGYLISGYLRIKRDCRVNWITRMKKLKKNPKLYLWSLIEQKEKAGYFERKRLAIEIRKAKKALKIGFLDWEKIFQVVILPTFKEPLQVLSASINSYLNAEWPNNRLIVVVAMEEREGEEIHPKAKALQEEFGGKMHKFMITYHPADIVGELKGKGANSSWAAGILKKYLSSQKIADENILVSNFDADTRVHPKYFSCLTYKYIIHPKRRFRSFQPIPLYSNNIWQVPSINRLVAFSSSFWQMIESTRPYRMVNFSSQAMSWRTLKDINFWDKTIVSEDSRQYYRAFFKYAGDHQTVPISCPVYMDAVLGKNWWLSLKNQYLQKRRWAWGIEHFPYFVRESHRHKDIPRWEKLVQIFRMIEGHINWATASLLIAFTIWFPFVFHPEFRTDVLGHNLPIFARYLLMLTWAGIIISATISTLLLPPRPRHYSPAKYIEMVLQWFLIPISAVIFGSLPAIEAQTRLMIGKYLGFWVTPKDTVAKTANPASR